MTQNILKPANDKYFPYWPGLGVQRVNVIPGQQMAGEVADIPINKSMYMQGYLKSDINSFLTPEALQDAKNASLFIEGQPIMGRGAGVGLTDMLLMSVAQNQAQAIAQEDKKK